MRTNRNPRIVGAIQGRNKVKLYSQKKYTPKRKVDHEFICRLAPHYYSTRFPYIKSKTGRHKVLCPFHDDRTPSLSVSLDHGGFRCFGCGISGDLIRFHMLEQQKTFNETLDELGIGGY